MEEAEGQAGSRPYRMVARAKATERTAQRILDTARHSFAVLAYEQVTLADIATDAGLTVQTVLRRFGSKEELFLAVVRWRSQRIRAGRDEVAPGDPPVAVRNLVHHYEQWGDEILPLLAQESRHPVVAAAVQSGRDHHRAWVERVFMPVLTTRNPRVRRLRLAQVTAVTDIYTWKVLRHDLGLNQKTTERAILDLATWTLAADGDVENEA